MKLRPAISLVFGIMAALLTACYLQAVFLMLFFSLLIVGLLVTISIRRCQKGIRILLPILIGALMGFFSWELHGMLFFDPAASYDGRSGTLTCIAAEYPNVYEEYASIVVRGETLDGETMPRCKLILYVPSVPKSLSPGDRLSVEAALELPKSRWDYDRFRNYRAKGIYLTAEVLEDTELSWEQNHSLREFPLRAAAFCTERIQQLLPPEEAGVLNALIFGDERGLSDSYVTALRRTGLSHITAVSGMNVSFLVGLLLLLFRKKWGSVLAIPTVLFFVWMTGGSPSILRAGIMQLIWLTAYLIRRESEPINSLFIACGLILLGNPYAIADVGLWLSFAATLGLLVLGVPLRQAMTARMPFRNRLLRRFVDLMAGTLAATIAAQVFVLPIQIAVFQELSLIAPLSNLLIVPFTEYAFTGGVIALLLSFLWMPLGEIAAFLPGLLIKMQFNLVPVLAEIPLAFLSADGIYLRILMCTIYPLLGLAFRKRAVRIHAVCAAVFLLIVTLLLSGLEKPFTAQISLVSTVSGQSVILHHRDETVVVNCGGSYAYAASSVMSEVERVSGRDVTILILTDYRNSSAGNAELLLQEYRVRYILLPEAYREEDRLRRNAIASAAEASGTVILTPDTLTERYLEKITVRIFEQSEEESDRGYLMPVLSLGTYNVLALGHLMPENVGYLLSYLDLEQVHCIAAGDHYAARAIPPAVYAFRPELCVFSSYAGTEIEPLSRVSDAGIQAFETEKMGFLRIMVPCL